MINMKNNLKFISKYRKDINSLRTYWLYVYSRQYPKELPKPKKKPVSPVELFVTDKRDEGSGKFFYRHFKMSF